MNNDIRPHGPWQTLGLHLVPGALITAFYFLTAPLLIDAGYPAIMALLLAILVVLIPFQLGVLLYRGWKRNGRLSLEGIVLYREPLPTWQYLVFVPLLLVWSLIVFQLLRPLDEALIGSVFAWLPEWTTATTSVDDLAQYSQTTLAITFLMGLVLNGIAGPLVEELYFRGYLLPRIPASRVWAPLINVLLFSLYHFFSPWQNVTRIVALIPLVAVVAWKRNIYLSIWTHCTLNTLGMIATLVLVLR